MIKNHSNKRSSTYCSDEIKTVANVCALCLTDHGRCGMHQCLQFDSSTKLRQAMADESRSTQCLFLKSNYSQQNTNTPDFTHSLGGNLIGGNVCNSVTNFVEWVWWQVMKVIRFMAVSVGCISPEEVRNRSSDSAVAWASACVNRSLGGWFACEC